MISTLIRCLNGTDSDRLPAFLNLATKNPTLLRIANKNYITRGYNHANE